MLDPMGVCTEGFSSINEKLPVRFMVVMQSPTSSEVGLLGVDECYWLPTTPRSLRLDSVVYASQTQLLHYHISIAACFQGFIHG